MDENVSDRVCLALENAVLDEKLGPSVSEDGFGSRMEKVVWARVLVASSRRLRGQGAQDLAMLVLSPACDDYHESLADFAPNDSHVDAPSQTCSPHPSLRAPRAHLASS